ncbi:MAG TPA: YIP1 family protein [Longimicrobiales bacterium]|nr:YIP1 family protein [Longimicrobiales bacterium]
MTNEGLEGQAPDGMAPGGVGSGSPAEPALRPFPARVVQTLFDPGRLTEALARNPAWAAAVILGAVLVVGQTLLIPAEVWEAMMRETMLRQGREMPEGFTMGGNVMKISALTFGTLGYFLMTLLFAGVVTLVFAFLMGDEGRFRQYLAMVGHSWLIPGFVGLLLLPLKIMQEDPQLTLNVGSFLYFLPEGYPARVAKMLDLSQAWAWLVVAQGARAIYPRRSFASAATVVMVLFVIMAMLFALIPGVG